MRSIPRPFIALGLALVLGTMGCAIKAHSNFMPGIDFSSYRSFAQAAPPAERPEALPGYSSITAQQIQRVIAAYLESRGLSPAAPDRADLVVSFSIGGEARSDVVSAGGGYYGWEANTFTQHYVVGRLVIDMHDRRTQQLVWHGWATKEIFEPSGDPAVVAQAVDAILAQFPPEAR